MKELLLLAQLAMPSDMYQVQANFNLQCMDSFVKVMEWLKTDYNEDPVVMSHMAVNETIVLFVNPEHTTSTLVASKLYNGVEEACIIWGGQSNGTSLSISPAVYQ